MKGARERNVSCDEYIKYLVEFERMDHIDDLIRQMRRADTRGFNVRQIVHLSVLFTLMKKFDRDYHL